MGAGLEASRFPPGPSSGTFWWSVVSQLASTPGISYLLDTVSVEGNRTLAVSDELSIRVVHLLLFIKAYRDFPVSDEY